MTPLVNVEKIKATQPTPAEKVVVAPIVAPTAAPVIEIGDEGGIPVTGPIKEANVVDSPEEAAEEMVQAVEQTVIENTGGDMTEATPEQIEEAVEQVNSGAVNNNSPKGGDSQFINGVEHVYEPITGQWIPKGEPGKTIEIDMTGNGVQVGY